MQLGWITRKHIGPLLLFQLAVLECRLFVATLCGTTSVPVESLAPIDTSGGYPNRRGDSFERGLTCDEFFLKDKPKVDGVSRSTLLVSNRSLDRFPLPPIVMA
uniref:Putative secreted protein n=1 Tax=Anopheles marajoara TaxID=58244 RepID=A0A2M4C8H0_9DIPT